MVFLTLLIALLVLLFARSASAHTVGVSKGEYVATGDTVRARLVFARPELAAAVPALDADRDGTVSATEIESRRDALASAMTRGLEVAAHGEDCTGTLDDAALTEQDGLAIDLTYRCARAAERYDVRLPLLASLSIGHRHVAAAGNATSVLFESQPAFQLAVAADARASGGVFGPMLALGVEHILTGYDHLLFLVGLVLVGGRWRSLLLVVTAFTVAHSITLGLAAFGVVAPSPRIVEPAIALSIAYVGVENWFVKDASRRWLLTFPFGLIHGFGFAGALQEVALSTAQIPFALVGFNLGVEAGQLAVLALVLPALAWLRKREWFARFGVRGASGGVALAGLVWFVARV